MKKTLIALAILTVSGASFAQSSVTISGKLRYAYESAEKNVAGTVTKANGVRVTDGDVNFAAVEDLGGGLKATASIAVLTRGRDTGISGRDASLSLAGNFGSVMVGSVEAGNGIIGLGGAGAPVYGMDGSVIAGASNVDIIKYTSPAFNGFTLSANATDSTAAAQTLGMGATAATADSTGFGVNYANGPLAVAADLTNYGLNASGGTADNRTRISASYDLGVAKLGLGHQVAKTTTGSKTKDMIMGVSVPVGAFLLGANYATQQTDSGVKVKGTDLGAQYNLSKRTFIAAHYQKVTNRTAALGTETYTAATAAGNSNNKFRIQLGHSF
jgi:predicted porin